MILRYGYAAVVIAALSLLTAIPLKAQSSDKMLAGDMFLRLEGIAGESQDEAHKDWIEILSYSHGLTNDVLISGGGGGAGVPQHSAITVAKFLDKSSPLLFDFLNKGQLIRAASFEFLRGGQAEPYLYLQVDLDEAYVTAYAISASSGAGIPFESISLVYSRITFTYWPQKADGTADAPIQVGWDVKSNTSTSVEMGGVEAWVEGQDVLFRWQTTSQTGNYGFEVQKLEETGFKRAAYVPGAGWSSEPLEYEVRIRGLQDGVHVFRVASLGVGGNTTYSEEISVALGVPEEFSLMLEPPYPNPFSERTNIAVTVKRPTDGRISVWDMLGREVAVVHEGRIPAGYKARYQFEPDGRLGAGVYVLRVQAGDQTAAHLLTVLP